MHSHGFSGERIKEMHTACRGNVTCFGNWPGIKGCMTRMLGGVGYCTDNRWTGKNATLSQFHVNLAINNIKKMAFIGLQEEWNEAVCQFHKQFGGIPEQAEFANHHKGSRRVTNESNFNVTYSDPWDSQVYQAGKDEFHRRYLPKGDADRCYLAVPGHDRGCAPESCATLGKQCGSWDDGCGSTIVCGMCPVGRDMLPESWRAECTDDGQCVQVCPSWAEKGLWWIGKDEREKQLFDRLGAAGAPVLDLMQGTEIGQRLNTRQANTLPALPVTDSVQICLRACSSPEYFSFAQKFCLCDLAPPAEYLKGSPTALDFARMMDLMPIGEAMTVARFTKRLHADVNDPSKGYSQPRCCPDHVRQPTERGNPSVPRLPLLSLTPNTRWTLGLPDDVSWFAHFEMGCLSYRDCELLGIEQDADVASFDQNTNICSLGTFPQGRSNNTVHHTDSKAHIVLRPVRVQRS
jgi:hypothetical protein